MTQKEFIQSQKDILNAQLIISQTRANVQIATLQARIDKLDVLLANTDETTPANFPTGGQQ